MRVRRRHAFTDTRRNAQTRLSAWNMGQITRPAGYWLDSCRFRCALPRPGRRGAGMIACAISASVARLHGVKTLAEGTIRLTQLVEIAAQLTRLLARRIAALQPTDRRPRQPHCCLVR